MTREKFEGESKALDPRAPKFNGIASVTAEQVRKAGVDSITTVVVDEPTQDNDAHALIALVTEVEPDNDITEAEQLTKSEIAKRLIVIRPPK